MNHALQNEEPVELWHVEVAPNDVRIVTLEQLDEAFQKGLVNERTRVFQDGMSEPAFLGELLGLDSEDEEEDEPEMQAAPPVSTTGPSRHYQETLIGLTATPSTVPQRSAPPPQGVSRGPTPYAVPSRAPAPQQAMPSRAPAARAASAYPPAVQAAPAYRPQSAPPAAAVTRRPPPPPEGAWPPVVARSAAPAAQVARSAPPPPAIVPSVVPLAMDLGDDLDFPQPKRRGKVLFLGVTVLAVAAGIGLVVTGQGQSLLSSLTASAPPPAPVKAAAAPPVFKSHALDVGDAPVKFKDAPAPVVITTRENEAQVLGATAATAPTKDESPAKSSPSKAAPTRSVGGRRAKGGGGAPHGGGGGGAHTPKAPSMSGGSKYDPLNGSL